MLHDGLASYRDEVSCLLISNVIQYMGVQVAMLDTSYVWAFLDFVGAQVLCILLSACRLLPNYPPALAKSFNCVVGVGVHVLNLWVDNIFARAGMHKYPTSHFVPCVCS